MRYVLGFDGGGTKTECVLRDEMGAILARARSGPSNPFRIGIDNALAALLEAAEQALAASGKSPADIARIHAGIAGAGYAGAIPALAQQLRLKFPNSAVLVDSDLNLALAATPEIPSIVVIAGTGSAVIGQDASGNIARAGGLGPVLGDPGSAYDIGRKAIVLGILGWQSGENSNFGKQILQDFHCDWTELQNQIRAKPDSILPAIFPIVVNAANQGDDSARILLNAAAEELSELVARVVERLGLRDQPFFFAKTGGVFSRSPFLDGPFEIFVGKIAPKSKIGPLPESIAEFAARSAVRYLDIPLKNSWR